MLLTFCSFAAFCIGMVVAWPFGLRLDWRDRVIHWWARTALQVMRVRVHRTGPIPAGGCLLVTNHLSYLDILVLASLRPLSFLSKSEVAQWPVIGFMARMVNVRFLVRQDKRSLPKVAAAMASELDAGHGVTFFPEGTSSGGDEVLPFRPALLAIAAERSIPVHYATLRYETPPGCPLAKTCVCWWGNMTFLPHLAGLLRLPSVRAAIRFGEEPVTATDRKQLATRLHQRVAAGLLTLR